MVGLGKGARERAGLKEPLDPDLRSLVLPLQVPRGYNYRAEVRKLIPQLQVLDEVPAAHTGPPAPPRLSQDWLSVKEAIKKGNGLPWLGTTAAPGGPAAEPQLAPGRGPHPRPLRDGQPHLMPCPSFDPWSPELGTPRPRPGHCL